MAAFSNAAVAGDAQASPAIRVNDIHKRFGGVHALRGVSLTVSPGEILGLVGHNGAGKSTLIRILMGDLEPDSGNLEIGGQHVHFASVEDAIHKGIGVVRQELDLVPELTLAENIFLGAENPFTRMRMLDRRAMGSAAEPLLSRVGLSAQPDARLGSLSLADQQLVAAARALRSAARVLLLDEPTSSLSPWEAERLFTQVRMLAQSGVGIIYISHRVDEVVSLCNRVVVLRDGQVAGEFEEPVAAQRHIIDLMAPGSDEHTRSSRNMALGETLLEVRDLVVGKHGPTSFELRAGEIVGLFGLIGAGRTTIARALVGDIKASSGSVLFKGQPVTVSAPWHGYQQGIAYLSESRKTESVFPGNSVRMNITIRAPQQSSRLGWLSMRKLLHVTMNMIQMLDIRPGNPDMSIELLSGGNQQKAVLARLLAEDLDVLILDEPTHGIDVAAKQDLLRTLHNVAEQGKGVIFISSELPELLHAADRILVMKKGKVVREFDPRQIAEREVLGAAAGEHRE
jgi:ribose transport system ATP-binding protein